jgi:hypothetical protein
MSRSLQCVGKQVDTDEAIEWIDDWEEGGNDDFDDNFDVF